jgi:glycosyltransferase involved in cell wall biosynthesis
MRDLVESGPGGADPVRVVHFICPTGIYGAERWILSLLAHLDGDRVAASVLTLGGKPGTIAAHRYLVDRGVRCDHIDRGGKLSRAAVAAVRAFLLRERVEILHTHGFKSDVIGFLASRGLPLRLVTTPHGWSANEGMRIAAYEAIGRVCMRRFDRVYPLSATLERDLLARGFRPEMVRMVRNAVDDGPLQPIYRRRAAAPRRTSGQLLFVGRISLQKGALDLLEGFARARLPEHATLVYAGAGPDAGRIEARAAELGLATRVRLCGFVADVTPLLREADALVLPSHSEGIPRVLMEACAAGVPAIATDLPGIRELIQHEHNGLLVPRQQPAALSAALERIYAQPDLIARLVINARRTIEEMFGARRLAAEYEGEYWALARGSDVIAQRHRGSAQGSTSTAISVGAGSVDRSSSTPMSGAVP